MRLSKIIDNKYRKAVLDYKREWKAAGGRRVLAVSLADMRLSFWLMLRSCI